MSNPIRDAIADFTLGQIAAPRVPTPTIDSPRMNIDYRQYPFGYGTSQATATASAPSYTSSDGSGPGPYRGPLDVMGMTQSVENQFVGAGRALSGAMSTVGLSSFMGLGSAISLKNLQRIENKIAEGEAGYALGMFNNRIIGVSPGLFGGYTLSGVLPEGLSDAQRRQLTSNLLSLREAQDNPKDFAVAPQPTVEPTDEERAASGRANIVFDDKGQPVKIGTTDDYVTTASGQYVSQAELQRQNQAKQAADAEAARQERARAAAEEAARTRAAAEAAQRQRDDNENNQPRNEYSIGTSGSSNPTERGGYRMNAKGGTVQRTGFVEGSPDNYAKGDTVADTVKTQVREGSFVLNAPTVEKLQQAGVLPKGVDNSNKKATIKAKKGGLMDVALSKGEYVIEPEEAQRIGYSFLEKINDQGKAEVDRRQAAADGGFINGYQEGGKTLPTVLPQPSPVRQAYVGEDIDRPEIPLTDNMIAQFEVYNNSKKQRKDVENLINALDDRENLALVALAETTAETDDIEAMMGVQTTVLNRVKSQAVKPEKYPLVRRDFKDVTDVKSALKQRTPGRGSGSFMFQYDGFEPKYLSPKINSVLKGQVPAFAITKIMASSANVLDPEAQFGEGLFPDTVTFYTREDAPLAKDMELNPQMRYVTTLGGHDFYSYEAAPESPDEEKIYKEYLAEKRKKKKN